MVSALSQPKNFIGFAACVGVRSQTKCGLPVLGSVFSSPLFLVPYVIGAFKFFSGYNRTIYADNLATKLTLAIAWCDLVLSTWAA